ncbi:mucoidy inhibitor MuiA family protein [Kibdelosporangium persicum]|uniref:Aspartate ammonia-lyase n=1 Tax=Kibdelosporangium persicum TaxID=2698649 RepID=A0ABX2F9L9_9PSEU|nr:mucoidy inhibitor MuiA family protein [Kibdelosporangium persicum]NRN68061.1 Aspartate ammonia-lyase [Kibdelosporangium persicum]
MTSTVEAPIVAVTVYPGQARVTRRATVTLDRGEQRVEVGGLPLGLQRDSVRVSGRGQVTVLGVDVVMQTRPRSEDAKVSELRRRLLEISGALQELADNAAVEDSRAELLGKLSDRAGGAFAKALAKGEIQPDRIADLTSSLGVQLAQVLGRKRELAEQQVRLQEEFEAANRELAGLSTQPPDRQAVLIDLDVTDGTVEFELSYVVNEASWSSGYDIRLDNQALTLTWYAQITQYTGEDWPECELALSTARPADTAKLPELAPWFLDRQRPVPPPAPMVVAEQAVYGAPGGMMDAGAPVERMAVATVVHGEAATTYRPARQVAVPSDGTAHRTTVAVVELSAAIDHVTAPVHGLEAYLRATAVNTSEHTLRPGKASVFHDTEFVGTTTLDTWAPGEEVELNLGVDDRIRVERELVRRTAGKAVIGGTKRREAQYLITVGNYGRRATKITVLDQIPVSRDDGIAVKDVSCRPEPARRTELGELIWELPLDPGQNAEIRVSFRVDVARGVDLLGWRE